MRAALIAFLLLAAGPALAGGAAMSDGPRALRTDATGTRRLMGGGPADIAPDGTVESVGVESTSTTYGKVTVTHFTCFADRRPVDGPLTRRVLARWNSAQLGAIAWTPHAARFHPDGHFISLVTVGGALWLLRDHRPWRRLTVRAGLGVAEARLLFDTAGEPLVFVRQSLRSTLQRVVGVDEFEDVLEDTDYDWSVARDDTGRVYVSAYDYSARTLVIAAAQAGPGRWKWTREEADTRESGWQHTLAASGDAVYVLTYYYRNAFNRGLNLVTLRGGAIAERHTYLRLQGENGGWAPAMAVLPDGAVYVSHSLREQADEAAAERFADVGAFLARRAEELTGEWEDEYRSWSVSVAALPRWRFISMHSPTPAHDTTPQRIDANYDYAPAVEFGGSLEGRLGDWDLGLVYLQSLLDDPASYGVQLLSGWVGVDQLLFGHDLKISSSVGTWRGRYSDETGSRASTVPTTEVEVRLLNQWRLGYGLSYRRYALPLPYYVYLAEREAAEFESLGAGVADATVQRWELFVGYSRVDYLTKYENSFRGLDLDVRGGIGLSVVDWDAVQVADERVDGTVDLALSALGRLGYVFYHRFHALRGAGFFVRGGYEGAWQGSGLDNERPGPREPDDEDIHREARLVKAAHHQLFHGPYLSLGLVY